MLGVLLVGMFGLAIAEPARDGTGPYHDEIVAAGGQGGEDAALGTGAGLGLGKKIQ